MGEVSYPVVLLTKESLARSNHHHVPYREPLVVNPRGHISDEEYDDINRAFEKCRSKGKDSGPPIYVIAPYNRCSYDLDQEEDQNNNHGVNSEKWQQSVASPEWVVLRRLVHLAKRSHEYMYRCLSNFDDSDWSAIFHETPNSFKSYSVLMRVNAELIVDQETSSTSGSLEVIKNEDGTEQSSFTRSMKSLSIGPRTLRQNVYRNVRARKAGDIVPGWNPIQMLVASLQAHFGEYAVFFYNEFCPQVIGIVWRPEVFTPTPFSALSSESSYPVNDNWTGDTLVSRNSSDLLRELTQYTKDMVTNIRVFDDTSLAHFSKRQKVAHDVEGLENVSSVSP